MKKIYSNIIEFSVTLLISVIVLFVIDLIKPDSLEDTVWYIQTASYAYTIFAYVFTMFIYSSIVYFFLENSIGKHMVGLQIHSVFGNMNILRFFVREYLLKHTLLIVLLWNIVVIENEFLNFMLLASVIVQYGFALMIYLKNKTFILDNILFTIVEKKK